MLLQMRVSRMIPMVRTRLLRLGPLRRFPDLFRIGIFAIVDLSGLGTRTISTTGATCASILPVSPRPRTRPPRPSATDGRGNRCVAERFAHVIVVRIQAEPDHMLSRLPITTLRSGGRLCRSDRRSALRQRNAKTCAANLPASDGASSRRTSSRPTK